MATPLFPFALKIYAPGGVFAVLNIPLKEPADNPDFSPLRGNRFMALRGGSPATGTRVIVFGEV
jgi:hypothetical protein